MKVTNKQFVQEYLKDMPAPQLITIFTVIKKLLTRHKIATVGRIPKEKLISEVADVVAMIHMLQQYNKCNRWDIASIMRILEGAEKDQTKQFALTSPGDVAERVRGWIEKTAHTEFESQETNDVWLVLQGNKRMYKRTLKTDLNKLLK